MRVYEKDTDIKVPNWYYKLPLKTVDRISDIGLTLNRLIPCPRNKRKKQNISKRKVTFYL